MTELFQTKTDCKWVGKTIEWDSPTPRRVSSCQFTSKREGVCLEYIPPGQQLYNARKRYGWKPSQLKAGNGHGESVNPRVLVRVDRVGTKGQTLTPHYYAPRLSSVIGEVSDD